jgi:UPF0271 protein
MKEIDINCDVGEGIDNEAELMQYIQSCNIACGAHAGDIATMRKVVMLAIKHNVKIGAHPSFPDKANFGRKSMLLDLKELKKTIQNQINLLHNIVLELGGKLHHIKPHGALYNDIATNNKLSLQFLEAIEPYKKSVYLFVPFNSKIEKNALNQGFKIIYEAFADRNYNDDLTLVSREQKDAVICSPSIINKRVHGMLYAEKVVTITGKKIRIKARTFCVHSDTKNALEILKNLAQLSIK